MKRQVAIIIICCILIFTFLAACAPGEEHFLEDLKPKKVFQGGADNYPVSYDAVDSISLVQAVISGINGDTEAQNIYKSIPKKHLIDLSQNEFTAYLEALKPPRGERVESFERLEKEDELSMRLEVGRRMPLLYDLAEHTVFFRLNYRSENYTTESIVLGIQLADNGDVFISGHWVRPILRLREFAKLYFDAVKKADLVAVSWLLEDGYQHFQEGDVTSLSLLKAENILKFYERRVVSDVDESTCTLLLPGRARYKQTYKLSEYTQADRTMEFREEFGKLTVFEKIPETMYGQDKVLMLYGTRILPETVLGRRPYYYSTEVHHWVGRVLAIRTLDEGDENKAFYVDYYGLTLLVKGNYDADERTWEGEILQMDVRSKSFTFGGNLRVGMSAYDFYKRYPFAPEDEFTITGQYFGQRVTLTAQIEDDKVARFIWSLE